MTPFLKDLLLITNPQVLKLSEYLNQSALLFILPCFYIAMIGEYFSGWNFKEVVKRSVIAFMAIKILTPLHVTFVDQSLRVSSELVKTYSPYNKFLTAYKNTHTDKSAGVWKKLSSIVEMIVTDPIVLIIFLLSYIAFFLLTQLYSLVYHLSIVLIGLCALLSIFSITQRSLVGAVKTSLWCILMPFVVAIVLCLIGDSDAFLKSYSGGIVQNLESLIQLLIMTVILLMTPMITSKVMSDSGISSVAENLSQMAAMTTLIGGVGIASKGAVAAGKGVSSQSKNLAKSQVSQLALKVMKKRESQPSGFKASPLDKIAMKTDQLINKKENNLAQEARENDLRSYAVNSSLKDSISSSSYKEEARAFLADKKSKPFEQNFKHFSGFREQRQKAEVVSLTEGKIFRKNEWLMMNETQQKEVKSKYGIDPKVAKEGFVYFSKDLRQDPLPFHLYQRINKPKRMEELKNEKNYLG